MRCVAVLAVWSVGLGACTLLVDTSGLSEPGPTKGAAAGDGATSDGGASDAARDALGKDAAKCSRMESYCHLNEECCSMHCGAFPFNVCQ